MDQLKVKGDYRLITEFCPASIAEQVVQGVLDSQQDIVADASAKQKLLQFTTDISYLMSFTQGKVVVDLAAENLLHIRTLLCLPRPIKFILLDFAPDQLKTIVQSSYQSLYPLPLPFVFEDSILMDICDCWHKINLLIQEHVSTERLVVINQEALHSIAESNAGSVQHQIADGLSLEIQKQRLNDLLRLSVHEYVPIMGSQLLCS